MQADVLVLGHDAASLEAVGDVDVLGGVGGGRLEALAQLILRPVGCESDAIHRADVDAGVAFDAERGRENGLDVAIQAALGLLEGETISKPSSTSALMSASAMTLSRSGTRKRRSGEISLS